MDALSDIHSICRSLVSDKITERKSSAGKLCSMLEKLPVIQTLDSNSDDRNTRHNARVLTWDDILNNAMQYLRVETSALQKAKEALSATTQQNRDKKKREISGLVKHVVRQADKRGPRLKSLTVISSVMEVLRCDYMCPAYGLDFSNILLKNILPVRKYWTELKSDTWHELLLEYCRKFLDDSCKIDRVLQSHLIYLLITGASKQTDIHPKKFIQFFTEVFNNIRKEKGGSILEYILSSLNVFISSIAANSRLQVCKLGETIFINILYLWNNRPSSKMKDEIVMFLRLQLQCHHPGGARDIEHGAFAADWDLWMSHMRKMYEVLYNDLKELGGRHRISSSKESDLKPGYVDLAAAVCHQLFDQSTHTIDVTQLPCTGDSLTDVPAKRRRLESGWTALRDIIVKLSSTLQVIPWLQLLSCLVEKYPTCLPVDEIVEILAVLTQVLQDCKKSEVLRHLFVCLVKFVNSYPALSYVPVTVLTDCGQYWQTIWSTTLRNVSSHRAEIEGVQGPGFQLLTGLIQHRLVHPEKYVWNLFLPSISSSSTASVTFLSMYLGLFDLPETYKPTVLGTGDIDGSCSYALRSHLLDWLIPKHESGDMLEKKRYSCDPQKLSCVLIGLVLRKPEVINKVKGQRSTDDHVSELERIYLESTFDCQLRFEECVVSEQGCSTVEETCHITELLKTLFELIQHVVSYFTQITEPQLHHLENITKLCAVVSKCSYHLLTLKVLTKSSLPSSAIFTNLRQLMKRLSVWFFELVKKEGVVKLASVVTCLQDAYTVDSESPEAYFMMEMMLSITPSGLIECLITLAREENQNLTSATSNSMSHRSSNVTRNVDEFDDLGFDDFPSSSRNNDQSEMMDMDTEILESQDSDDNQSHSQNCVSLLSEASLSDAQRIRLHIVRLLCLMCSHDSSQASDTTSNRALIKNKLCQLLDEDVFDTSKAVHIQILRCLIMGLTTTTHQLTDTDLENLVDGVRVVAKNQRKDQELSSLCLRLIECLVPYCVGGASEISEVKGESRNVLLHLVSAFWKVCQETHTAEVSLSLVHCMAAFLKHDPTGEWSLLRSQGNNNEVEKRLISEKLVTCLNDNSHKVRLFISSTVQRLFSEEGNLSQTDNDVVFAAIYQNCNDLLDLPDKLSAERKEDERRNRTACLLLTLAVTAATSEHSEKKAVFAFCQMIREKQLDVGQVKKILCKVSKKLEYEDVTSFLISHLPFVINQWLTLMYPIAEFPYQLLDVTSLKDFYRKYKQIIIPELFLKKDTNMEGIKAVCQETEEEVADALTSCIPRVATYILPLFAASHNKELPTDVHQKKRLAMAKLLYNKLCDLITEETFNSYIVENLDSIVVNILMCLHDSENNHRPEPNPPFYNKQVIEATLDYLTVSFSSSLVTILIKTQDGIQKILLELSLALCKEHRTHEKLRILEMYELFVQLLLPVFHQQLGGSWAFVLRDVIYRLSYLIVELKKKTRSSKEHDVILEMCLSILFNVCSVAVEHCPQELCKYLRVLTSHVTSCVQNGGKIAMKAKSLLQLVVLDNTQVMKTGILSLNSFPDTEDFKPFLTVQRKLKNVRRSFTLEKEVENFLNVCTENSSSLCCNTELLKHLYQQLVSIDHADLMKQLKNTSSSGDEDTLLPLVRQLLTILQTATPPERTEAARCLGVIGPVELPALALPRQPMRKGLSEALRVYEGDPDSEKYCRIFHQLDQYLCDPSIDTVKCAGEVLKKMLATKSGMSFSSEYKEKMADKDYLFHYLQPFRTKKKTTTLMTPPPISTDRFFRVIDSDDLWTPANESYDQWVTRLTYTLLQSEAVHDELLYLLYPLCKVKTELCCLVLPYIIYDILLHGNSNHRDVISHQFNNFFKAHCTKSGEVRCISKDMNSVRCMLDVVQYLRQQQRPKKGHKVLTPWDDNFWLDINYVYTSRAAHFCSSHFTSLLYAEIWCDVCSEDAANNTSSDKSNTPADLNSQDMTFDLVTSSQVNEVDLQDLMLETYRSIGDPDGIYGCGAGRLADSTSRIKTYRHENRWDKAVVTYNIDMTQPSSHTLHGFYQSVKEFGASYLLQSSLQGLVASGQKVPSEIEELQYEAAWKTGQWDLNAPLRFEQGVGFHQGLYCGVEAVRENQLLVMERAVQSTRKEIVKTFQFYGDCCESIYPLLTKLHCLQQLDQVHACLSRSSEMNIEELLEKWNEDVMPVSDFTNIEPVLALRCSLLHVLYNKQPDNSHIHRSLIVNLLHLSKQARQAHRFQISEQAVSSLRQLQSEDVSTRLLTDMEEAKLYWQRQENDIGKHLIKNLIKTAEKLEDQNATAVKILPQALGTYGNWLAETRSENPTVIMENYLERTVELLSQTNEEATCLEAFLSLARFADNQYQNIVNYMKSSTYEAKQALLKKAKSDVEEYKSVSSEKDRYLRILEKQSEIDERELLNMKEDRNKFLLKALEFYIKCLQCGDNSDLRIFRVVALWFDDCYSQEVNDLLMENIEEIKSYKFLPLMYQLAARMGSSTKHSSTFQAVLNKILERSAVDHPHHVLSIILALAFANKDLELVHQTRGNKRSSKTSRSNGTPTKEEDRVEAAKEMISRLKKDDRVCNILTDMERLSEAYIQLANTSVEQHRKDTAAIDLPSNLAITKMKDLHNVAFPTVETKVDPSCKYDDIVYVCEFEKKFKLAGGINLPKIITCKGSDGIRRRQLVKGRDDLRQDAVMQQVFGMVNSLLQKNVETRKRKLHIRQYKVIPLSQRSGILEWCEGTQPLGDYLIGNSSVKGAHSRYRPLDIAAVDARRALQNVHSSTDIRKKLKVYKEVCRKFKPVFRHFFMEKFSQPAVWFERRLAYTRSVATNSIVGYIVGLGDRHVQNILVDCNTAELVHIDLGIAFEQGKILPTPETVSFRLTRDIVDGMGPTGVEGVFRRCCEKTMEVMHNNQEALMTIVQVLLYDPLYVWTLSPQKAHALQLRQNLEADDLNVSTTNIGDISTSDDRSDASQEQVNKLAERVLLRLQQKLQGIEDSVQLSVQGQVNLLIEQARDPKQLCRLFPGWQPHL